MRLTYFQFSSVQSGTTIVHFLRTTYHLLVLYVLSTHFLARHLGGGAVVAEEYVDLSRGERQPNARPASAAGRWKVRMAAVTSPSPSMSPTATEPVTSPLPPGSATPWLKPVLHNPLAGSSARLAAYLKCKDF